MTRPLALLRPEPGWSASAAAARAMGLEVTGHPLFTAEPLGWAVPEDAFDALLVGSGAAFRLGGDHLAALKHLPVHAVGAVTAAAAREAGFTVANAGQSDLQQVLDAAAGPDMRFLRLAGENHVAVTPHPGQRVTECVVYRMTPRPLDQDFARDLAVARPVVALHSAATATHFASEIDRLAVDRSLLVLLALAPRIAEAAGLGWAARDIADVSSDAALLAKAAALCK